MTPKIHPAALLFPMMVEDELAKLAEDIKVNGLIESIVLYGGQVLDGRNRLEACKIAGVAPHFEEADGDVSSPTLYVLSKNLHRRHLTVSQRAAIGAEVVPMLREEAHQRQIAHLKNQSPATSPPCGGDGRFRAPEVAAKEVQVSARSVERALEVKREAPEVFEQIKRGEITAAEAVRTLDRQQTPQKLQRADAQKDRLVRGLSTINGICVGFKDLDIRRALSACDAEEWSTWTKKAKELGRQLNQLAARLKKGK